MNTKVTIQKEPPDRFPAAQAFYESVDYHKPILPESQVFTASVDDEIIGVVRLIKENGSLTLRGMMIADDHQGQGIGTQMLNFIEPYIGDMDCYCLPHDWLDTFYGQIDFKKIRPEQAPKHLQDRYKEDQKIYPNLILMKRSR